MKWWIPLILVACGDVATFPDEPVAEQVVHAESPRAEAVAAPVTPDVERQAAAPAPEAWPPIRPPEDGRERVEPFDWPFEARGRASGRPMPEVADGDHANNMLVVDAALLR